MQTLSLFLSHLSPSLSDLSRVVLVWRAHSDTHPTTVISVKSPPHRRSCQKHTHTYYALTQIRASFSDCVRCGTERSGATSLSLFPDKEQVKSIISLQLQEPQPEIHPDFQMLITLPGGVFGPHWGSEAITERAVGRASHFSHPVQLSDIEFL